VPTVPKIHREQFAQQLIVFRGQGLSNAAIKRRDARSTKLYRAKDNALRAAQSPRQRAPGLLCDDPGNCPTAYRTLQNVARNSNADVA
jgi:hypothetical protein